MGVNSLTTLSMFNQLAVPGPVLWGVLSSSKPSTTILEGVAGHVVMPCTPMRAVLVSDLSDLMHPAKQCSEEG